MVSCSTGKKTRRRSTTVVATVAAVLFSPVLLWQGISSADNFHSGSTTLVSKHADGTPADGGHPVISADGRYVAFASIARLTSADTDDYYDIYRADTWTGETVLVSPNAEGVPHDRDQVFPSMSSDGAKVAYISGQATNSISGDTTEPGLLPTYTILRDIPAQTSVRLSRPGYRGDTVALSGDGRWAAVTLSPASSGIILNFIDTATLNWQGWLILCNTCSFGEKPAISYNGRFVAYRTEWLTSGIFRLDRDPDENGIFDEQLCLGASCGPTIQVSYLPDGTTPRYAQKPTVSFDGNRIGFAATIHSTISGLSNGKNLAYEGYGIYMRDVNASETHLASSSSLGVAASGTLGLRSSISGDGKFIAFSSLDANLVPGDFNPGFDVFSKEVDTGKTHLISTAYPDGPQERCELVIFVDIPVACGNDRLEPAVSQDGRFVAFQKALFVGDQLRRIFLRDRLGTCAFMCLDLEPLP